MQRSIIGTGSRGALLAAALLLACGGGGGGGGGPIEPADPGTLQGQVRADGTGVAGVAVTVTRGSATQNATTTGTGTFTIANLAAGVWQLGLTMPAGLEAAPGQTLPANVTIQSNQTANVTVNLRAVLPTVNAVGTSWSPGTINVPAGSRVRFANNSGLLHNVTPVGHTAWATRQLPSGDDEEIQLPSTPATLNYQCTLHLGMTGVINVQ